MAVLDGKCKKVVFFVNGDLKNISSVRVVDFVWALLTKNGWRESNQLRAKDLQIKRKFVNFWFVSKLN